MRTLTVRKRLSRMWTVRVRVGMLRHMQAEWVLDLDVGVFKDTPPAPGDDRPDMSATLGSPTWQ